MKGSLGVPSDCGFWAPVLLAQQGTSPEEGSCVVAPVSV